MGSHSSNSKLEIGPKREGIPSPSEDVLPRPHSHEDPNQRPSLEVSSKRLQGAADMLKRPRIDLKLGTPSRFGPISSLEFEE